MDFDRYCEDVYEAQFTLYKIYWKTYYLDHWPTTPAATPPLAATRAGRWKLCGHKGNDGGTFLFPEVTGLEPMTLTRFGMTTIGAAIAMMVMGWSRCLKRLAASGAAESSVHARSNLLLSVSSLLGAGDRLPCVHPS